MKAQSTYCYATISLKLTMSLIVEDSRNLNTGLSFRGRKIKQTKTSVAVLAWNGPNNIRDSRIEVKCVYGILQLKRINLISELCTSAVAVINDQARADIVDYIVEEIDATVEEEKVLTLSCETKVNQTIKSCDECAGNICAAVELRQERKKIDLRKLLSVIHKPVILVASLGKKVVKEAARFGKRIGKVVNRIGDKVKSTVKKVRVGIKKIGSKIGSHVKRFGKGIAKIGKNIGRGVAKITKKVGRGIKKFGQGVKKTGKKVWKKIKKIFGKRSTRHLIEKRCVSSCPVCDKLDKEIFTDEQIVGKICGASFVSRQKQLYEKVRGLEDTYNYIVSNAPVVTKVEYETSSIIIVNGKLAFKKSFVTYQTNKINRRFQLSGLFEISNIDGMAIIISKDILKKMQ